MIDMSMPPSSIKITKPLFHSRMCLSADMEQNLSGLQQQQTLKAFKRESLRYDFSLLDMTFTCMSFL